eukprot:UN17563
MAINGSPVPCFFILMEYADLGNLVDFNKTVEKEKEKILWSQRSYKYSIKQLVVLRYLHSQGVVHRDLKPENLMVFRDGKDPICPARVTIGDFGSAGFYKTKKAKPRNNNSASSNNNTVNRNNVNNNNNNSSDTSTNTTNNTNDTNIAAAIRYCAPELRKLT